MTTKKTLRLGTRGSQLARTQSGLVADAVRAASGHPVELVIITTRGDQIQDRPLSEVGGKGLFTKEIEQALLDGDVDFAVHSLKDMPVVGPVGLMLSATPKREDPRDALCGATLASLKPGARVGTGSLRRALQLQAARPDVEIVGIRGNVDTRLRKQRDGDYDAVLLAVSGLNRLGASAAITEVLDVDTMIPAVGQGALALQCRVDDAVVRSALDTVHDEPTARCVAAERAFLTAIGGDCHVPAAAHAWFDGEEIVLSGCFQQADGALRRARLRSDPLHVTAMGRALAEQLRP